jgi:tetratricopeptide (TPR) repeat protein
VNRREKFGLAAALALALALRVALVLSLRGQPYSDVPIVDSAAYDRWAVEIATKSFWGERPFYQDPLYPYGLGVFYKVFGRDLLAVRLVQALIGTAGLWMLFGAVRRFLGYRTAMAALVLGAVYRPLVFYDTTLLKEFLGPVAIEAALLFWSLDRKWKWAAFGAALGLGVLVRGNLLLVSAAAAGFLAFRREWKPAGWVLAGTALAIAPATIRNLAVSGDFVLTTSQLGPNLYIGNNPENLTGRYVPPPFLQAGAPEFEEPGFRAEAERLNRRAMKASEVDAYWRGRAFEWIGGNFGHFLGVTIKRFLMLLSAYEVPDNYNLYFMERFSAVLRLPLFTWGLFLAPLAAAGVYLSWIDRSKFAMLHVLGAAYFASILFFFVFARYRLPLVPILLVFAAYAGVRTAEILRRGMRQVPKTVAAVFAAVLLLVNVPLPRAVAGHRDFRAAHYNLGIYHKDRGEDALAAAEFESAARLNPDYLKDPVFVGTLAGLHGKLGNDVRAFELQEKLARELDPASPRPLYELGRLYARRGMEARASQAFTAALERDPGFLDAYLPLAESLRRDRKFPEAVDVLHAASRAAPKDPAFPLRRAGIHRELSMWKEMKDAAEQALLLRPGDPAATALRDEAANRLR